MLGIYQYHFSVIITYDDWLLGNRCLIPPSLKQTVDLQLFGEMEEEIYIHEQYFWLYVVFFFLFTLKIHLLYNLPALGRILSTTFIIKHHFIFVVH